MITKFTDRFISNDDGFKTMYAGLSTDTKPTDAHNGDQFLEINTAKMYTFNEADSTWVVTGKADGTPTDAQVTTAVDAWLDDHPEATTTVEDGSITVAKFANSVVDASLTEEGHPADAKAVGDLVSPLLDLGLSVVNGAINITYEVA